MKKFIALFLVFSILALSGDLYAEKKGAELIVQKTDGTQVRGELITVKQNSLLLLERESEADVSVDIGNCKVIKVVKKSKALSGFIHGICLGLVGGFTYQKPLGGSLERGEREEVLLKGVISFALIGTGIGAALGTDKTIRLEDKSDFEIQEILEKLRKKARIKKVQ